MGGSVVISSMCGAYLELALAIASLDLCDADEGILDFDDCLHGLFTCKIHTNDECLKHYTDMYSFESILKGGQLRLKKYDKMFRDPREGEHILDVYEAAIMSLREEGLFKEDIITLLTDSLARMRNNKGVFKHFMFDTNEVVECTPYCICFTPLDFNSLNEVEWLSKKDLCIHFNKYYLELNKSGILSKSSFGAVDLFKCQYADNTLHNEIKKYIRHIFRCVSDVNVAIPGVEYVISTLRICITPTCNAAECETRLVFFLPNDLENHPKIKALLSHRRGRDDNNNFIDVTEECDSIYLNLKPLCNQVNITCNGKSNDLINQCEELIRKYGYIPCVFNSKWHKKEKEFISILGRDNLNYDACLKMIDELVSDTTDPIFSISKAILALEFAMKVSETEEQYGVCSKKAIELLDLCSRTDQPFFVTLLRGTLSSRKKWSKEYFDCVYQTSLRFLVININYSNYNDGLIDVLLKEGNDILSEIVEDILKRYGEAIFRKHRVRYLINGSDVEEYVEGLNQETNKEFYDLVNAIIELHKI